jgi:hypothetical protein
VSPTPGLSTGAAVGRCSPASTWGQSPLGRGGGPRRGTKLGPERVTVDRDVGEGERTPQRANRSLCNEREQGVAPNKTHLVRKNL